MNLTTDAWIPIVWNDGTPGTVNLREAFEHGHKIQDLALRPHERIALMRLLICIAQAALDGPADYDDWKTCRPLIAPSALDYLERWRHAFELFGKGERFLQVSNLKKPANKSNGDDNDEGNSTSKLDLALATGNNTTLFDNAGGSDRSFEPARVALMLLTFQCFSPGGTIGVGLWNGAPTVGWSSYPKVKPGQSNHAPCLPGSMLHAFLRGASIGEAVYLNLLNKHVVEMALGAERWGHPVWECMPKFPNDTKNVATATSTYLGRLIPLARAVRLNPDHRSVLLANGLTYPAYPEAREPSATVVIRERDGEPTRVTLGASLSRALWRELYSLTVKRIGSEIGGPLSFQNLADLESTAEFDLWAGALVTDKTKAASILDTVESVFHVPAAMLEDPSPSQRAYEQGVKHAESTESRLRRAVTVYHKELGDNLDRPEMKNRRKQIQSNAAAQFWTDIEHLVPRLLEVAVAPESLGLKSEWHKTSWGQSVWRIARAAYERACPHETPRQIRAYALGLKIFFPRPTREAEVEIEGDE
jgi:CRISPR system Cascade subunit CasA